LTAILLLYLPFTITVLLLLIFVVFFSLLGHLGIFIYNLVDRVAVVL